MEADEVFVGLPMAFWANVRSLSQAIGYTERRTGTIKVPTQTQVETALLSLGLTTEHISRAGQVTDFGHLLLDYFAYRARVLNDYVRPRLMDATEALERFTALTGEFRSRFPLTMNKQKGEKAGPSLFTNAVNHLIERAIYPDGCDFNPQTLTTFTKDRVPLRTLARRLDGAYPSTVNPVALWEIKEYYYTTTFGSRVADGVYETLLDGLEIEELRKEEGIECKHYLFIDSYYTWWGMGRSYLCRMIDMLHMAYVDEIFFGREIYERLPAVAASWRGLASE